MQDRPGACEGARAFWLALIAAAAWLACGPTSAEDAGPNAPRESMDDAWWTGPLLAANASTLPPGHFYLEPYVYDSVPYAALDASGHAHDVTHQDEWGSLTYINYGLADGVTIGMLPRFGYDDVPNGASSTGIGVGDLTLQAQYRLTRFQPGSAVPTIALNLQETLPTGRYDRLDRPSNGFGSGAYTTTLSIYSQSYFWLSNGRILRARLNVSYALSSRVDVEGMSVYGTGAGFRGQAAPGASAYGDLAFEYSITRNWVAAIDLWYERDASTRVSGTQWASYGPGRELFVAPALEYNWSAQLGVIFGVRLVATGRNETGFVTPVAALSYFL